MKIIAISLFYKPIMPGFGTRYPELLIDESTKARNNLVVFTSRVPKEYCSEPNHKLSTYKEKLGSGNLEIHRLWTTSLKHEGFFKRALTYISFILQCFFKIINSHDVDIILGIHPYPPFFLPIIYLAKLKKIKFLLVEADLWPDNLKELGIIKNKTIYSLIEKWSRSAYNKADLLIVITEELKDGLKKYFIDKSKIKVLQLSTDTEIFKPLSIKNDSYSGKFVVMYSGIFSPNYDFDIILNSAKKLKNENILFVISGAGEIKNQIKNKIQKYNLKNVVIEEPLPNIKNLVEKLNKADVLVMGMNDNKQAQTAHPSKIFEFMACGKPIVCSSKGATNNLLKKSGGGIIVEPGDYIRFSDAIMQLYNSPQDRKILGDNGLKYIRNFHSLQVFQKNLSSILKSL